MRRIWIVGVVGSSLALAACGATASITQALNSLGSSPYLQVHLTMSASGQGSARAQQILNALSLDMKYSSTSGSALAQSAGSVNTEVDVLTGTTSLLELRVVDGNVYVMANVAAFASIPTVTIPASSLAAANLLLGGRWFEFPKGLINSYVTTTTISASQAQKEQAIARAVIDALSTLLDKAPYTTLPGGGYTETGTLKSIVTAVLPSLSGLQGLAGKTVTPTNVKGTYTISLSMSGGTATGGSIRITAPNGTSGNASVGLDATVTHDTHAVDAPAGATVITKSLLQQMLGAVAQQG